MADIFDGYRLAEAWDEICSPHPGSPAIGRDYADIPPLKGIYHGAPAGALAVTVEVTRLA